MAHAGIQCCRHLRVRRPWPTFSLLQLSMALLGMQAVVVACGGCGGDPVPLQAAAGDDPGRSHGPGSAARPSPAPAQQQQQVGESTHPAPDEADVACAADEAAASCSDAGAASSTCRSPSSSPKTCTAKEAAAAGGQARVAPAVVNPVCPVCRLTTCTDTKCYGRCRKQGMVYCCCENRPKGGACFCNASGELDGLGEGRGGGANSVGDIIDDAAVDYSSGYGYDSDQNDEQRTESCGEGPDAVQPAVHAVSKDGVAEEGQQSGKNTTESDPDVGAEDRTVLSGVCSAKSGPVPSDGDADTAGPETGKQLGQSAAVVMRQITRCPRCRLTMCTTTRCFGLCRAQRKLFCCCLPRPGTPCRCTDDGMPGKGHGSGAYAPGDDIEHADVDYTRGYDYDYHCVYGAECEASSETTAH